MTSLSNLFADRGKIVAIKRYHNSKSVQNEEVLLAREINVHTAKILSLFTLSLYRDSQFLTTESVKW